MPMYLNDHLGLRAIRRGSSWLLPTLLGGILLVSVACMCGGNSTSGDHTGQLNGPFQIAPSTATVIVGQSLQFVASSPGGGGATWTVLPIAGGTVSADGMFTASATPGVCQVIAMWNGDLRDTATAAVSVVPMPAPAHLNTGLVQAFGHSLQVSPSGSIRHAAIAGEPLPAAKSATGDQNVQVRHGFLPPPSH